MDSNLREFPETHWSQLLELGNAGHPRHAEHLERLARRYWKPIYLYVRAIREMTVEDAEDATQQFFGMLLGRIDFSKLSPDRGSFRGFLKTALRRFVVSADRKAAARAPKGGARLFRYEEAEAERIASKEGSPEEAFDRAWTRGVIEEMLARLKGEVKPFHYDIFREYCLEGGEASYEELARRHGASLDDVRNGLRAVRQRGREILKGLLRDYLFPGEDVEQELRFVLSK